MKLILTILLIALVTGSNVNKEGIDIFLCILKNEKIQEEVIKVLKAFETKDISTIISTVFSAYFIVKENVMECIDEKPALRSLSGCVNQKNYDLCRSKCKGMLHLICKKDCYNCWCL